MAKKLKVNTSMAIKSLAEHGTSSRWIARLLGVHENVLRDHLEYQREGATDGRTNQAPLVVGFQAAIDTWLQEVDDDGPLNLVALHDWLVAKHHYPGSLRSLQGYFKPHYPQPRIRARRRAETPPETQG